MKFFAEYANLNEYLRADSEVDWHHPAIQAKANALFIGCDNEIEAVSRVFDFICNSVDHSADIKSHRVRRIASEVLHYGEGICYAKTMLLAALLRHNGIPCGF